MTHHASAAAEVAAEAARLAIDEGLDFDAARRKAARALGRRASGSGRDAPLPSLEQVEDEVRAQLALFHDATQPIELRRLRELALRWLERLDAVEPALRPHLAGQVWRGTATRHSPIVVDLYADDPKAAQIALVDLGAEPRGDAPGRRGRPDDGGDVGTLGLEVRADAAVGGAASLLFAVRDHDALRGALRPDARGRAWRGDAAALRRLLAAGDAAGHEGGGARDADGRHDATAAARR